MDRLEEGVRVRLCEAIRRPCRAGELRAIGLTDNDLRRLVRRQVLLRFHKRYVGAHLDPRLARIWCTRAAHPGAAVSHFTAAQLAQLRVWVDSRRPDRPPADAVWLTRPAVRGRSVNGPELVLRRAGLDSCEVRRHNGLWVTNDARTVADLARELPLRESLVTIDHALAVAVTSDAIADALERQRGWPGVERARTALALGDRRSESALESIARATFVTAGLPRPVLQASFAARGHWLPERVDFWWPEFRTVAEADGLAKYDAMSASERRRLLRAAYLRERRIAELGLEIVRFGWEDIVDDPDHLLSTLRGAFARGQRTPTTVTWRSP